MDELYARLDRLERDNRRLKRYGGVAWLLLAGMLLGGMAFDDVPEVIRARRFEVPGEPGKPAVVALGKDEAGSGILAVNGPKGSGCLVSAGASLGITVFQKDNKPVVLLGEAKGGDSGVLTLFAKQDKPVVELGAVEGGGGGLSLRARGDQAKKPVVWLAATDTGGTLALYDPDAKSAASLRASQVGGVLGLFNRDEKNVMQLGVDDHGGALTLRGKDEKGVVGLGADEHGGFVTVFNKTGEPACTLDADATGSGKLGAWDRQGKGRTLQPGGN